MRERSAISEQIDLPRPIVDRGKLVGGLVMQQFPSLLCVTSSRSLLVPIDHPLWVLLVIIAARDKLACSLGKPECLAGVAGHGNRAAILHRHTEDLGAPGGPDDQLVGEC
jgi:hypothetical protein